MLHGWFIDFGLYYESSTMERASLREQQGHFCRCLDPTLAQMMREKMDDQTPIFKQPDLPGGIRPPPSCMEILEAEFLYHHPMMFRRLTMLQLKHRKSETLPGNSLMQETNVTSTTCRGMISKSCASSPTYRTRPSRASCAKSETRHGPWCWRNVKTMTGPKSHLM